MLVDGSEGGVRKGDWGEEIPCDHCRRSKSGGGGLVFVLIGVL